MRDDLQRELLGALFEMPEAIQKSAEACSPFDFGEPCRSIWLAMQKLDGEGLEVSPVSVAEAVQERDASLTLAGIMDLNMVGSDCWKLIEQVHEPEDDPEVEAKRGAVLDSLCVSEDPIRQVSIADALAQDPSPEWPTALSKREGVRAPWLQSFRGVTMIAGGPSAGKSWWAIGSGIKAAWTGEWRVIYVAAEMSAPQVCRRAKSYCQGNGIPDAFEVHEVDAGVSIKSLVDSIAARIDKRNMLVILDSITSFVDQAVDDVGDDVHRMGPLKRMTMWMLNTRRMTNGAVSLLCLSERNAAGEVKGRFGAHKADMSISIVTHKEDPRVKVIDVLKSWESDTGPAGYYGLNAKIATLELIALVDPKENRPSKKS